MNSGLFAPRWVPSSCWIEQTRHAWFWSLPNHCYPAKCPNSAFFRYQLCHICLQLLILRISATCGIYQLDHHQSTETISHNPGTTISITNPTPIFLNSSQPEYGWGRMNLEKCRVLKLFVDPNQDRTQVTCSCSSLASCHLSLFGSHSYSRSVLLFPVSLNYLFCLLVLAEVRNTSIWPKLFHNFHWSWSVSAKTLAT